MDKCIYYLKSEQEHMLVRPCTMSPTNSNSIDLFIKQTSTAFHREHSIHYSKEFNYGRNAIQSSKERMNGVLVVYFLYTLPTIWFWEGSLQCKAQRERFGVKDVHKENKVHVETDLSCHRLSFSQRCMIDMKFT